MTTTLQPSLDFDLPADLEAHQPPEARGRCRDDVRLLVGRGSGEVSHHAFTELPDLLLPGDVLVVNRSATIPAAVDLADGRAVHFSTVTPDGSWLVEVRLPEGPDLSGRAGDELPLPGGASVSLLRRHESPRLWHARLSHPDVLAYLGVHGRPIRYGYVAEQWPLSAYQTTFATVPGSAEMPSAARPFTPDTVNRLVSAGVLVVPITLHCGVASPEFHEPPYAEWFDVPDMTAHVVNAARNFGHRVIAVGSTAVRALESAVGPNGQVRPTSGWTERVVTPEQGVRVVDGLLTGLHEPKASHLLMLEAIAGRRLISVCYAEALTGHYLWHEFGDVNLLLP
ncbi:S-adenosylmethionine:tRNA ribosyltransferase-isomerase [Flindersiella endophytica]